MPKNKVSEWSSTAASNTDIGGIDIAEGCAPSGINNAIRELMAQVKDQQAGTDADNFTVGGNLAVTGTTTTTGAITANGGVTGNLTGNVTGNVTGNTSGTAANVTGTVAVANGGTGLTTLTANNVMLGNGTSAPTFVAPGTSGNVLTSNGTTWVSQPISAVTSLGTFTTTSYANGGTINGSTLTLSAADGTKPGLVSTVAQTIAGAKTFSSDILTNNDVRVGKGVAGNTTNTVLGKLALVATSTVTNENIYNTAIGISTMQNVSGTGSYNTAVGANSAFYNNSGSHNTYLGYQTGYNTTSGTNNVAIGSRALYGSTTGNYLTGAGNNAIGFEAMKDISTTAADNIAIGLSAGTKLTTGTKNIFIGSLAGSSISTGSTANTTGLNSILIGYDVRPLANADNNEIVISGWNGTAGTVGLGSNTTLIGSSTTTDARIMGALNLPNTTSSTSTTSGALTLGGGAGIAENINVGGTATIIGAATISNTTASSSTTTGALKVGGGAGIAGNVNVGGTLGVTGATTLSSTLGVTGATTLSALTTTGTATISNTTNASSTSSAALVVRGGVGIASDVKIGGTIEIDGGSPGAGKVLTSDATGVASWTYGAGTTSTQSGSYTITLSDKYVFYSSSATGSATFTLPAAASNGGKEIIIKNKSAYTLTIQRSGSETIFQENSTGNIAATSITLGIESSNNWVKLVSDGTQWVVFRALF
jgi:hypothetical protein